MSLHFRSLLKCQPEFRFPLVVFVDVFFLLLGYLAIMPVVWGPSAVRVDVPGVLFGEGVLRQGLSLTITGENIVYSGGRVLTLDDLGRELAQNRGRPLVIRADRRSSLGRISEIWELARRHEITQVSVVSDTGRRFYGLQDAP